MGPPLGDGDYEATVRWIDAFLIAVRSKIVETYGNEEPSRQAVLEMGSVVAMDGDREHVACKRALLLFALSAEPSLQQHWPEGSASARLSADLCERVLPFALPRFIRHSCQAPVDFVQLVLVLSEMWQGESLGNYGEGVP